LANQANSFLSEQLQSMKLGDRKVLLLYYGFGLNQKQLADRLEINQSTISRYLTKSTIKLLEVIAKISQPQQWVKQYIERWLEREYQAPVHSDLIQAALVSAIKKLANEEREILQLYYGEGMDEIKIASQLEISLNEIATRLTKTKNHLQEKLIQEINIWMKEYLEKWLDNYYKSLIKLVVKNEAQSANKELNQEEQISLVEMYIQNQSY
jgi:DNA-directed RNA polymerase specialized sigma24 family protein